MTALLDGHFYSFASVLRLDDLVFQFVEPLARVERGRRQYVVAVHYKLVCGSTEADFPDEVVYRP